jgi:hypothetical protein
MLKIELTLIFQKYRKGLKLYPLVLVDLLDEVAGTWPDKILMQGFAPGADITYGFPVQADDHDVPIIKKEFMIDPPFLYDGTLGTGMSNPW